MYTVFKEIALRWMLALERQRMASTFLENRDMKVRNHMEDWREISFLFKKNLFELILNFWTSCKNSRKGPLIPSNFLSLNVNILPNHIALIKNKKLTLAQSYY